MSISACQEVKLKKSDALKILVLYDDPSDPIIAAIASYPPVINITITLLSLQEWIETVQVYDQINQNGIKLQWTLKHKDGSTIIWTNEDTYLFNRCHDPSIICDTLFHPDDRGYATAELTAYLRFVVTAFKNCLQPTLGYKDHIGTFIPLHMQWEQLKGTIEDLAVPSYYMGRYDGIKWPMAVLNINPYDITHWINEIIIPSSRQDYVFAYQRPKCQPVFVYITPLGADIFSHEPISFSNEVLLKQMGMKVGKGLGLRLGEVLFFVSEQQITLGGATPHIISTKNASNFQTLTFQNLTNPAAYQNNNQVIGVIKKVSKKLPKPLIVIGSIKDSTINSLVKSHVLSKRNIFLALEELGKNWNFTYADGQLIFSINKSLNETLLEVTGSVYYRYFYQETDQNNIVALLDLCLDSCIDFVYSRQGLQHLNSSKPLQLIYLISILKNYNTINFPPTIISKGITQPTSLEDVKYIVKSISGIRSIVVGKETFTHWDQKSLQDLPTLFQEKIEGPDWRIQVIGEKVFAIRINGKSAIDYRYAEKISFEEVTPCSELVEFCLAVSRKELNTFIGIDLIQTSEGYVFLEANPSPGWDYFFKEADSKEKVCEAILHLLSY